MPDNVSRRSSLKAAAASAVASALATPGAATIGALAKGQRLAGTAKSNWSSRHDRVWIGGDYWANPMEDWRIADGAIECASPGGNRSVHSLVHQLVDAERRFSLAIRVRNLGSPDANGGASLRIGIRSEIDEYRSNCFVQKGLDAGILEDRIVLGDRSAKLPRTMGSGEFELLLRGEPRDGGVALTLTVQAMDGKMAPVELAAQVASARVLGNVAVVSNFSTPAIDDKAQASSRFRFSDWRLTGDAFAHASKQRFGPILWAMYTLSDTRGGEGYVLKLSALTGPMGPQDSKDIELQVQRGGKWSSLGTARLDPDAWVATFRIANWEAGRDLRYRLLYRESLRGGAVETDQYAGTIRAAPAARPLRMAALTCQNDYAFPYEPVANNVLRLQPDLVLFSGDQIYENHGGFGVIRAPADRAILNYLRKYYQFGWAFRDVMRHAPTVCLPDDHDVLQGNLWGEGGAAFSEAALASKRSDGSGGYIEPPRVVNAVHRTTVSHLPDPVDPAPVAQGISVYHTELVYGGVGFAIIADRQWKSGPERLKLVVGETGQGENPRSINPAMDRDDLQLLGARQEAFLARWASDWRGHKLKAVISQSVFAGVSTHQPEPDRYLKYDIDSNGWPRTARDRAVRLIGTAKALHICGDTHLGTLTQYGVEAQRDSSWAFCTPAIAAGWPRWWRPDAVGLPVRNRPAHGLAETGEYQDSFGNRVYVYAVANPDIGTAANRYAQAQQKGSGFGMIEFDTQARTYTLSAYRFFADPAARDGQFPGWPVVIHQEENGGRNRLR
ncbi:MULTISPECIES: alkaline phosphatase D family protein [Sphingomonas]|uniref:Twin-arginine translocation pathway signal n=1 Tax=Sphingomonas turrisvirgatae TaxID=1888892 RepID=A0A1E3LYX8_9SPHN|nr:alkaline phosphatase D family protein [Sphingomonas turrisvirgatae]ODP38934.1 twin-arginine translocation pathway signal [Sphingomonas turrisvirgatae]